MPGIGAITGLAFALASTSPRLQPSMCQTEGAVVRQSER
jgi:hypothetical protein